MTKPPKDGTADPFQSLTGRREKARAEPPRIKVDEAAPSPQPTAQKTDKPFDLLGPGKKKKSSFKTITLNLAEPEFYLLQHIGDRSGMSNRTVVEAAMRFYAEHHAPELIIQIEEALNNGNS
jgi:hypothetical protein